MNFQHQADESHNGPDFWKTQAFGEFVRKSVMPIWTEQVTPRRQWLLHALVSRSLFPAATCFMLASIWVWPGYLLITLGMIQYNVSVLLSSQNSSNHTDSTPTLRVFTYLSICMNAVGLMIAIACFGDQSEFWDTGSIIGPFDMPIVVLFILLSLINTLYYLLRQQELIYLAPVMGTFPRVRGRLVVLVMAFLIFVSAALTPIIAIIMRDISIVTIMGICLVVLIILVVLYGPTMIWLRNQVLLLHLWYQHPTIIEDLAAHGDYQHGKHDLR